MYPWLDVMFWQRINVIPLQLFNITEKYNKNWVVVFVKSLSILAYLITGRAIFHVFSTYNRLRWICNKNADKITNTLTKINAMIHTNNDAAL